VESYEGRRVEGWRVVKVKNEEQNCYVEIYGYTG